MATIVFINGKPHKRRRGYRDRPERYTAERRKVSGRILAILYKHNGLVITKKGEIGRRLCEEGAVLPQVVSDDRLRVKIAMEVLGQLVNEKAVCFDPKLKRYYLSESSYRRQQLRADERDERLATRRRERYEQRRVS